MSLVKVIMAKGRKPKVYLKGGKTKIHIPSKGSRKVAGNARVA